MRVLVVNAGSSSLKVSVLETAGLQTLAREDVSIGADATQVKDHGAGLHQALKAVARAGVGLDSISAAGHRVVHGGTRFTGPALVDADVLRGIDSLAEFAPLHNRVALEAIRACQAALPGVPQVASFDTAFHAGLPPAAHVYPLPYAWYTDWGIRRFGFHGLSVSWSVQQASNILGRPASDLQLVVAHLGSGCSVTAVDGGRSAATSMGLTPLEGLMMGTRAGSIDPGILLFLLRTRRRDAAGLELDLDHRAGLLGIAGNADMRAIEKAAEAGDERARLAIDMFVSSAAAGIAAAATALPRLDGLVFTGGIGEHAPDIRSAIGGRLRLLGDVPVLVVEAREDAVIAQEVDKILAGGSRGRA